MKVVDITATAIPFDAQIVQCLRYLAGEIEAGRVRHVIIASLADGAYRVKESCSPHEGLVLATLLQRAAVDRLYEGPQT